MLCHRLVWWRLSWRARASVRTVACCSQSCTSAQPSHGRKQPCAGITFCIFQDTKNPQNSGHLSGHFPLVDPVNRPTINMCKMKCWKLRKLFLNDNRLGNCSLWSVAYFFKFYKIFRVLRTNLLILGHLRTSIKFQEFSDERAACVLHILRICSRTA